MLGRPEVAGALLEVDGNAAVRGRVRRVGRVARATPRPRTTVVRAINDVVAQYRAGRPAAPLRRRSSAPTRRCRWRGVSDPTTISNETDEAADLAFTTSNLTKGNALHAAAARAKFLSDAPYGTLAQIPWLGRQLYLPELAVGRLVETPLDIQRQLKVYVDANGTLTAGSALTTGYDFLTDGASEVDAAADGARRRATPTRLLDDTWTATTLKPLFVDKPIPDSVLSVNAHYSHWLLQPAAGSELVSTAALPALPADPAVEPAFARRVIFVMGCHSGLNVADTLLPGSTSQRLRDWAQSLRRAAGRRLRREHRLRLRRHRVERALRAADEHLREAVAREPADRRELGHGARRLLPRCRRLRRLRREGARRRRRSTGCRSGASRAGRPRPRRRRRR